MANTKQHRDGAPESWSGFFARWFDSVAEARMRQAQLEIGDYGSDLDREWLKDEHVKEKDENAEDRAARKPH